MRSWPGLAAIGAGLIHLGVAAGSAPPVLVLLALVGAAETGWGVAALARRAVPVPRAAFAGVVLLVAAWIAVLLGGGAHQHAGATASAAPGADIALPIASLGGAGALDLTVAVLLAVRLRRGSATPADDSGVLRYLLATAAAAGVVAVVTATSLAGTAVGAHHVH